MKKILTVSLFAMMAVSAANADIASTKYVTDRTGSVSFTAEGYAKDASDLTEAINVIDAALKSTSNNLTGDITSRIGELETDVSAMDAAYKAADTALDGRLTTAEGDIDDLQSGKANKATTLAGYGITDAMTASAITTAISTAKSEAIAASDTKGAAAQALSDAKAYADAEDKKIEDTIGAVAEGTTVVKMIEDVGTTASTNLTNKLKDYSTTTQMNTAITNNAVNTVVAGTANGTILVDNSPVSITGLKSAAYTESSAYDAAGAAAQALADAKTYADAEDKKIEDTIGTVAEGTTVVKMIEDVSTTASTNLTNKLKDYSTTTEMNTAITNNAVNTVVAGTANGTILVDNSPVSITGLKSAAYTESSAYATSAQGTKADNAVARTQIGAAANFAITDECKAPGAVCSLVVRAGVAGWEKVIGL